MIIKTKKYDTNQTTFAYLDHFMYSILSFLASFGLIFYMLIEVDTTRRSSNYLVDLLENEKLYLLICFVMTIGFNLYFFLRNKNKQYTYKVLFNDTEHYMEIENRKKYSNRKINIRLNYKSMQYRYEKQFSKYYNKEIKQILISDNHDVVSLIKENDFIWDKHQKEFNMIHRKLQEIEYNSNTQANNV